MRREGETVWYTTHWTLRNREERAVQGEELMQLEVLGTDSRVH